MIQNCSMMKGWKEIKFKDFIKLNRGFDLPNDKIKQGNFPVVASTTIKAYHELYRVKGPGVVTGRSGSLGTVQYIKSDFWPLNTSLYVKDFKGNNPRFVYYFLQLMHLENFNSGAGVPTLNQNHLHHQKILIPKKEFQSKIASILAAYDDLIEVNKQQIALLEEEARELYKEWFVRMRFPGYKSAKFVNGIPEGWEYCKINDVFEIIGGGTPNTEKLDYWENGEINWFSPTDLTGDLKILYSQSSKKITEKGLKYSSAKLFPAYSIMMTSRATIGVLGINTFQSATNQGFIVCIPNEKVPLYYLYYYLYFGREYFTMYASGATFLEISKSTFKKLDILVPLKNIVLQYNECVTSIFERIEYLQLQNQHLSEIRDHLLPRLMSGRLSVKK